MHNTKIEWCDSTWNPVTGCLHGCEYCYARKQVNRFKGGCIADRAKFIQDFGKFEVISEMHKMTKKGNIVVSAYPFGFEPTLYRYRLDIPQKWTKPHTIFVCSMADLFGDWIPDEWIGEVFAACKNAPQHRYLFLTKNPKRYSELQERGKLPTNGNMWYGTSVTNIKQFEQAADVLGTIPMKVNLFFSVEPLLEDITVYEGVRKDIFFSIFLKWIIIGAETGNRADKVIPKRAWIDNICTSANVPIFMKDSLIPIVGEKNMRRDFPWNCYK